MQQKKPEAQMMDRTAYGRSPNTEGRRPAPPRSYSPGVTGGRFRKSAATGTVRTRRTANPIIVIRQPCPAIARSNNDGHVMPAMYCPDEIRAKADPRRRSNQRLTKTISGG